LENQKLDGNFSKKIIFSDDKHFQLDECMNTQICRIWCAENPRVIHEKPLHGKRDTVWCWFWAGGVIGPYFFQNEAGNAVTVNGVRYRNMITEFMWPQLDGMDMEGMWFNRTAQPVTLRAKQLSCCEKIFLVVSSQAMAIRIGHRDPAIWHRASSLFGGSRVYANKPQTIPELKAEIRSVTGEIEPQLCGNVIKNFDKRARMCQQSRGGHLSDIAFQN